MHTATLDDFHFDLQLLRSDFLDPLALIRYICRLCLRMAMMKARHCISLPALDWLSVLVGGASRTVYRVWVSAEVLVNERQL